MRRTTFVVWLSLAAAGCAGTITTPTGGETPSSEPAPIDRGQNPPPGPYAPEFDIQHYDIALDLRSALDLAR